MKIKRLLNIADLLVIILISTGCEKEPLVITLDAAFVTNTTAELRASYIRESDASYIEFEYGGTHDYGETITGLGLADSKEGITFYEVGDLKSGQTYFFRAILKDYKNADIVMYGDEKEFNTTVKDKTGNDYNIVTIGTQTWMKENLKTSMLNDGTAIPVIVSSNSWSSLSTSGCCWLYNDINYRNTYGTLYNWWSVYTGNLCPAGWHVPTDEDWGVLVSFLGENAGGAMKEAGTVHWNSPNAGATNSSGFTGLAGGKRSSEGDYYGLGNDGYWWSTSWYEDPPGTGTWLYSVTTVFGLFFNSGTGSIQDAGHAEGYSVRCIRD